MNKKILLKLLVSLGIAFVLAALFLIFAKSKTYQILELKALDLRFVLKGNRIAQTPILHINIDDESLSKLGRWPWPRSYHAKLVDALAGYGVKQILMDILFAEKSKDNPQDDILFSGSMAQSGITYLPFYFIEEQITISPELKSLVLKDINVSLDEAAKALKIDPQLLKDKLRLAKELVMDEAVRELVYKEPEISLEGLLDKIEDTQSWNLFPEDEKYITENFPNQKSSVFFVHKFAIDYPVQKWPFRKEYKNLSVPIREYIESMKRSGFINAEHDFDGVTRKIPLFIRYKDKILPQLTVAALMDFLGIKDIETKKGCIILKHAQFKGKTKDIAIPVDEKGCMLVNWQGQWGYSFNQIPYYKILEFQEVLQQVREEINADSAKPKATFEYLKNREAALKEEFSEMVKDKICLVGLTATGTHDLRPIPLEAEYPMVGTHSNLINTILTGNFIRKKDGALSVFIFFFTALIIGFGSLIKLWKSLLLSICYAIGYFLIAFLVFVKFGLWIDLVGPEGIIVFGFSAITSFRYFTEEKEKLWIKQAFSHYLSKEVINELMENPDKLKLGGERKNLTVLFSDIRGFTTFSESHQPEEVVAMLNEILTRQVEVVFKHNGTLDKFVGDELMAFYGAPGDIHKNDHASVAVRTAVEIQSKLNELKQQWAQAKKEPLQIGIGINTGDMVVGNMGSLERMDYTVIGDNVNLAARLCSAAGRDEILISETTYEQVRDEINAEKLEPISVKGKAKPVSIYKVVGLK